MRIIMVRVSITFVVPVIVIGNFINYANVGTKNWEQNNEVALN